MEDMTMNLNHTQSRFSLGQVVATPNALERLDAADIGIALARHSRCDWGDLESEDMAENEERRNFELRLRDRERKLLNKIEKALEKISTGTFGTCESCDQEIDLKRLEARPVAGLCIDCKTEQEDRES